MGSRKAKRLYRKRADRDQSFRQWVRLNCAGRADLSPKLAAIVAGGAR